jgi:hypothetical protein
MSNTSTYLQTARLNQALRGVVLAPPLNTYLALFTADPTDAANLGVEVTDAGYARLALGTATGWSAPAAAGGGGMQSANINQLTFGAIQTAPVTIAYFAIMDAASGGNMLYHGPLAQAKAMQVSDVLQVAAGQIVIVED